MEQLKFEEALKKLEKIVQELEEGELDLDKALKKFEEGINLSRYCNEQLEKTEKKVEILIKKKNGSEDYKLELFKLEAKQEKENEA